MKIRPAVEHDSKQIASLCQELGYSASVAEIAERIRKLAAPGGDLVLVAEDEARNVRGWIQVHASTPLESGFRVEILGLVVSTKVRRSGVGRKLVEAAEWWARSISAPTMVVRSNLARQESHAFYPALGYVQTKTQHVYRKALAQRS